MQKGWTDWDAVWEGVLGRPRSGPIADLLNADKRKYKKHSERAAEIQKQQKHKRLAWCSYE